MNRVAIITVNFKGIDDTLACLKSLSKQTYNDLQIIIVENGSQDDSDKKLKQVAKEYKNLHVIYNKDNLGFAGGCNVGIKWALAEKYDFVAMFNNDAVADKKWVEHLVEAQQEMQTGITTGLLLHEDGKTIDSTGDWYSNWGLPFPRNRNDSRELAPEGGLVFSGSGGGSLYSTKMLQEIGLFDEDFFAYYEDTDLSFRAQLMGWKIGYTPNAVAYHKQGATSSKIPGFAVYQTFKNLPLFFIKDVPRELLFPIGIRFYFAYLLMLLNAVKNGNGSHAFKGAWKNILLTPNALRKRRRIQQTKKVPTSYIKSMLWPDLPPDQTGIRRLRKFFTGKP